MAMRTIPIFLLLCLTTIVPAQQKKPAAEPPIPVYVVCPYHEDSLRTMYEGAYPSTTAALGVLSRRTDTLSTAVQKASAQMSSSLTLIYGLLILVMLMSIVTVVSLLQIRRQLSARPREAISAVPLPEPVSLPAPVTESTPVRESPPVRAPRRRTSRS